MRTLKGWKLSTLHKFTCELNDSHTFYVDDYRFNTSTCPICKSKLKGSKEVSLQDGYVIEEVAPAGKEIVEIQIKD